MAGVWVEVVLVPVNGASRKAFNFDAVVAERKEGTTIVVGVTGGNFGEAIGIAGAFFGAAVGSDCSDCFFIRLTTRITLVRSTFPRAFPPSPSTSDTA